ncbi:MAG: hypothetical protein H6573_12845 [Lewinellaceae bacterium]|nr:hypothetical protein [Lewinellaceae bacterium]
MSGGFRDLFELAFEVFEKGKPVKATPFFLRLPQGEGVTFVRYKNSPLRPE